MLHHQNWNSRKALELTLRAVYLEAEVVKSLKLSVKLTSVEVSENTCVWDFVSHAAGVSSDTSH